MDEHRGREQPLPAWAVAFDHPSGATLYVAAELGTVVRVRNRKLRAFDFLWMLHTMDYHGRDDFNNVVPSCIFRPGPGDRPLRLTLFVLTSRPVRNRILRREERIRAEARAARPRR